jgi:hypothetical protein
MRRFALIAIAILGLAPRAEALTIRDIIELSRSGLGEDVLLALIEVDRGIYGIDTDTLKSLKAAGVPEKVIVALVRSGRERPVAEPAPVAPPVVEESAPPPQVVVIEHREEPRVREVMVPVPIYVPVDTRFRRHRAVDVNRVPIESTYVPFQTGPPPERPRVPKAEPVYWGFGGKLRPDAWKPDGWKPDNPKPEPDGRESEGRTRSGSK